MLRTLLLTAATATILFLASDDASARGGRGGGCCGGGCCYSGCYGGGCYGGGCAGGVCYGGGYYGGGYMGGAPQGGEQVPAPKKTTMADSATLVVSLPADATLTINGQATRATSAVRVFHSPSIQPGSDYSYTLKAEVTRDGKTESISRDVTVRAGEQTRVELSLPVSTVASVE